VGGTSSACAWCVIAISSEAGQGHCYLVTSCSFLYLQGGESTNPRTFAVHPMLHSQKVRTDDMQLSQIVFAR
jgi:hypothetical protein